MTNISDASPAPPANDAASPPEGDRRGGLGWFAGGFIILFWTYAVFRLGPLWYSNEDYSFGWFVPLLSLCLFWERWKRRPRRDPVRASSGTFGILAILSLFLLPAALLLEVMPLTRLAGWTLAATLVVITLIALYFIGGKSYSRHFVFPVLFILIAVPWPSRLEAPLVENLSKLNAIISTVAVNFLGTPAVRHGVLIETGPGLVGVDEACSGIRSFQASVMVALFLGELFRYGFFRRMALLLGGVGVAFLCNVVRTVYLVRICDVKGLSAVNLRHDQAGFIILGITFVGLLGLAWLVRPRQPTGFDPEPVASNASTNPPRDRLDEGLPGITPLGGLRAALIGVGVWVLIVEMGIALWFNAGEKRASAEAAWSLHLPKDKAEFQQIPISKTVGEILHYSEGIRAEWRDAANHTWQLYYLRWAAPRNRYQSILTTAQSRGHAADVCLRNSGMTLKQDFGTELVAFGNTHIEVKSQRFLAQGRPFHVFSCYWDPHVAELGIRTGSSSSWARTFNRAWSLVQARNRSQVERRVLKIGLWDVEDDPAAQTAFREVLSGMVRSENSTEAAATKN